jgi:hypothetical protein
MENHAHMVAIYAVWYNRIRVHKTLRVTSAMAAGLSQTVMDWPDVIALMESSHLSGGGVAMGYQYELLDHRLARRKSPSDCRCGDPARHNLHL